MTKIRAKQLELFSRKQMRGGICTEDVLEDWYWLYGYLVGITLVNELNDEDFNRLRTDCEDADTGWTKEIYSIGYLPGITMKSIQFSTLKHCIEMKSLYRRHCGMANFNELMCVPPLLFFADYFVRARKIYKQWHPKEYEERGNWIIKAKASKINGF